MIALKDTNIVLCSNLINVINFKNIKKDKRFYFINLYIKI